MNCNLFTFIFAAATIYYVSSCRCMDSTPDETFCRSDWVSHVKVTKKSLVNVSVEINGFSSGGDQLAYSVKHMNQFKMTAAANKYQETVYTSSSSASCGIDHLGEGSEYLMAGSVNEKGRLFISSCSDLRSDDINNGAGSPQEWNGMTKTQKAKLLNGEFGKSC